MNQLEMFLYICDIVNPDKIKTVGLGEKIKIEVFANKVMSMDLQRDRLMMQRLYILLLLFIANIGCYAQYGVTGYVVDNMNKRLDNVNVLFYLSGDSSRYVNGVTTDMKGHFAFQNVNVGSYRLVFSTLGYMKQEREVRILNNNVLIDTVRMQVASELLEEVVVKADLMQVFGEKESRIFSPNEKKQAPSGLELISYKESIV